MKLSVVIPVFNEEETIEELVSRVSRVPFEKELLIVDDCSTDRTGEILESLSSREGIKIFRHEVNQGKEPPYAPVSRRRPATL